MVHAKCSLVLPVVMDQFLRTWRQDAVERNQLETAIFIGDKVFALTNSDADALALARIYFAASKYSQAENLLEQKGLQKRHSQCKYIVAHSQIKQGHYEDALNTLGERHAPDLVADGRHRKLAKVELSSHKATETQIGAAATLCNEADVTDVIHDDSISLRKFEASMCYLRGLCYAKQNALDRAKECYKDAVSVDVQCFEAFEQLMKNALMSPDEEWAFLETLNFDSIIVGSDVSASQQAAELTEMLYVTRLSKYKNPDVFIDAVETLSTHYQLSTNSDLVQAKAELLFTQCRFQQALLLTESILEKDRYNFRVLPVHLACLYELHERNALFLLAHDLADRHPEEAATWLAVGVYYLTIGKIPDARRFFSKSSMMDPHFGPSWIGFAHTFAIEGEHDQAISAYSTASRLFQGTHLPQMFLGMQYLQLHQIDLAQDYLQIAYGLCQTDPLLLNELGVGMYHEEDFDRAIAAFNTALAKAKEIDSDLQAWLPTRANLGQAYRRMQRFPEALAEFDEVLKYGGRDAGILTTRGLVLLEMNYTQEAIISFHEALSINPQDVIATDLLNKALEEDGGEMNMLDEGDENSDVFSMILQDRKDVAVKSGLQKHTRNTAKH